MTSVEIVELIEESIKNKEGFWLGNHNLHSAYLYNKDERFREYYRKSAIKIIDGWPILQLAKLGRRDDMEWSGKMDGDHRVGSSDWIAELLERKLSIRVLAIGGTAASSTATARKISEDYPFLEWKSYDGFEFGRTDTLGDGRDLAENISRAELILVGMGMPTQEEWIYRNFQQLDHAVVANVGGCLDYFSGAQSLAPRWTGPLGLEWAYRLVRSPRRLFWRYVVEPVLLAGVLVRRRFTRTGESGSYT